IFITRARYDRLFAVLFLLSIFAAIVFWKAFANLAALSLPLYVVFFWALLRCSCPKQGTWSSKWAATSEGRIIGLGHLALPAIFVPALLLKLLGLNHKVVYWIGIAILSILLIVCIFYLSRREKQQRAKDSDAIPDSLVKWNNAEATLLDKAGTS